MNRPKKRTVLAAASATLILVGGGTAVAAVNESASTASPVIYACAATKTGAVRIINFAGGQRCT